MPAASHSPVPNAARAGPFISPAGHGHAAQLAGAMPMAKHSLFWDPISASVDCWSWVSRLGDIWWTHAAGATAIAAAGRTRFEALVRFARERSPLLPRCLP